jgi:hypothetical protein
MKPIRVTHLVFDEIFFTTDFTCSLKLSLSETNKKPDPGSSSIPAKVLLGNSCYSKLPLRDIRFKVMFYWK